MNEGSERCTNVSFRTGVHFCRITDSVSHRCSAEFVMYTRSVTDLFFNKWALCRYGCRPCLVINSSLFDSCPGQSVFRKDINIMSKKHSSGHNRGHMGIWTSWVNWDIICTLNDSQCGVAQPFSNWGSHILGIPQNGWWWKSTLSCHSTHTHFFPSQPNRRKRHFCTDHHNLEHPALCTTKQSSFRRGTIKCLLAQAIRPL